MFSLMSVCIHACIQSVCYNGWVEILAKECPQEPVKEGNEGKSLFLLFYSIVSPLAVFQMQSNTLELSAKNDLLCFQDEDRESF